MWGRLPKPDYRYLNPYCRSNHFPCTFELGRKDRLHAHLSAIASRMGYLHCGFHPRTFIFPRDRLLFRKEFGKNTHQSFIIKPVAASRGIGIHVVSTSGKVLCETNTLAQEYISNPLLIRGFKFDLRLYLVITGYDPLRIYLYRDGLARFASESYNPHNTNQYSHLTNFSINKGRIKRRVEREEAMLNKENKNEKKEEDPNDLDEEEDAEEEEHRPTADEVEENSLKWRLVDLRLYLRAQLHVDDCVVMRRIQDVLIKTFISADSTFRKELRSTLVYPQNCSELYGVDIILDDTYRPWILEINTSPSMNNGTGIDGIVKGNMLSDYAFMLGHTPLGKDGVVPVIREEDVTSMNEWMKRKHDKKAEKPRLTSEKWVTINELKKKKNGASPAPPLSPTTSISPRITDSQLFPSFGFPSRNDTLSLPLVPSVLEHLSIEDKCLLQNVENEYSRRGGFQRIFPTPFNSRLYAPFFEERRYTDELVMVYLEERFKRTCGSVKPQIDNLNDPLLPKSVNKNQVKKNTQSWTCPCCLMEHEDDPLFSLSDHPLCMVPSLASPFLFDDRIKKSKFPGICLIEDEDCVPLAELKQKKKKHHRSENEDKLDSIESDYPPETPTSSNTPPSFVIHPSNTNPHRLPPSNTVTDNTLNPFISTLPSSFIPNNSRNVSVTVLPNYYTPFPVPVIPNPKQNERSKSVGVNRLAVNQSSTPSTMKVKVEPRRVFQSSGSFFEKSQTKLKEVDEIEQELNQIPPRAASSGLLELFKDVPNTDTRVSPQSSDRSLSNTLPKPKIDERPIQSVQRGRFGTIGEDQSSEPRRVVSGTFTRTLLPTQNSQWDRRPTTGLPQHTQPLLQSTARKQIVQSTPLTISQSAVRPSTSSHLSGGNVGRVQVAHGFDHTATLGRLISSLKKSPEKPGDNKEQQSDARDRPNERPTRLFTASTPLRSKKEDSSSRDEQDQLNLSSERSSDSNDTPRTDSHQSTPKPVNRHFILPDTTTRRSERKEDALIPPPSNSRHATPLINPLILRMREGSSFSEYTYTDTICFVAPATEGNFVSSDCSLVITSTNWLIHFWIYATERRGYPTTNDIASLVIALVNPSPTKSGQATSCQTTSTGYRF
ncbi:putative Tubulin polyglutamylase TTLL4 [Blattamonas nauphoetae]|uniref:Tubulin--tyrosine ligase-like protein 5 n=1 Tax=Blattamonas nauphoetae TaxID=2049346 RepID=A0ABQ9XQ11_9EUKA|nr:putative Tubulin polyglutamylase TTLL4 [Blattamonas nauphoetae]